MIISGMAWNELLRLAINGGKESGKRNDRTSSTQNSTR